jgi:hypothetical protein
MTDLEIEELKGTIIQTVSKALHEIERLRGQIDVRDSVIAKLSGTVAEWRPLLERAADALEETMEEIYSGSEWYGSLKELITELREAAE